MTRHSNSTPEKPDQRNSSSAPQSLSKPPRRVPIWQALVLPLAAILIFFLLLEGGLALFGFKPALSTDDPFVGFAFNVPLFVPAPGPRGGQVLTTAENKLNNFNPQSFPLEKAPGAYRIFCLGGSTTFGRPYDDATSFSSWLRELLPLADKNKNWEVINAGGISYASYRVANLMEELVKYQPDLFIIYTGHNEFLEERTYSKIKDIPPVVRSTISVLAKTRTWSAMTSAMQSLGIYPEEAKEDRAKLGMEVNAILDQAIGLERYTRDDPLKENILKHYRISLERMVAMARSVGAQVIFVTPASQLKDCTPFKSEHTQGLDPASRQRLEQMLAKAKEAIRNEKWDEALNLLETAVKLDPRHAELQYRLGLVLLALGRFDEAGIALRLARDEDVCPLRALTPMRQIVTGVAREQDAGLVDYVDILEKSMQTKKGYPIPGEEYFLDHVHPTIEGHKILAVALIQALVKEGVVQTGAEWGEQAISAVERKIEGRIDKEAHGRALANLARVLLWARKLEDAARLARQAQDIAGEYLQVAVDSASILVSVYAYQGQPELAVQLLHSSIEKAPGAIELRLKLGETIIYPPFQQIEEAAANLLLVCQQLPHFDVAHALFGMGMAKRGRPGIAYPSLLEALRLNPNNAVARRTLDQMRPLLRGQKPNPQLSHIILDIYPSRAPRMLTQIIRDSAGRTIPHGVQVEFHENGRLKRFVDIDWGKPNGAEIIWDRNGNVLSRKVYRQGMPVSGESGK